MASLNTLRTKGGWFLTIVIALALLAFVLSDLVGRGGNQNPVVGEINGVKIKYSEFLQERDIQDNMLKGSGGTDVSEEAYNRAWTELVTRNAFIPGFESLGLAVSEQEQIDMTSGTYISPVIMQFFRNPQTGMFDMEVLRYFIANMTDSDLYMWQMIQQQMNQERLFSKYGVLVANGLMVDTLQLASAVNAANNTYNARVVYKPYSSISDSTVSVSSSDVKKYYDEHKEKFRRETSRDIEYVVFDIVPSADDMAEGQKRAETFAAELAAAPDPEAYARLNSPDDKTPARFVREDALDSSVAAALLGKPEAVYGPVLSGETFTISRLAETRMIPDSVTFSAIILTADKSALADSLMGVANRDNFAELARTYSDDPQSKAQGGEMGTMDPLDMIDELSGLLIDTPKGQVAKTANNNFIFIVNVTDKTAPVSKVKIATIKYTVQASSTTHAEAMNKARDFYTAANGTYDGFKKAANEMSLPKRVARIRNTDRNVSGLDNSLTLVRWAYDNKLGAVSEPEELSRDYIVVSALAGITEEGYEPLEQVSDQISRLLVQRKKADMLAEQLKGSSLDQIAQSQNLEIHDVEGLNFSAFTIPGIGMEPRLVGAICTATQTGALSKPVKGSQGVYMFEVTDIQKTENTTPQDQKIRLESMNQYFLNNLVMNALYEKADIKDERVRYF